MTNRFRSCAPIYKLLIKMCFLLFFGISLAHAEIDKTKDYGTLFIGNATALALEEHEGQACEEGLLLSVWRPTHGISTSERILRGTVYFFAMVYLFIGVSIVCDRFMSAIEVITSIEKEYRIKRDGRTRIVVRRVWNATVANLTLMALGSSAPEILLSVIEIFATKFEGGDLGPGTIIGSAAYNLLVVIAICISIVPKGEVRRIQYFQVFIITASWSLFAYIWLYAILAWITPGRVDVFEGILTLIYFPAFVLHAYIAERRFLCYKLCGTESEEEYREVHLFDEKSSIIGDASEYEDARREYIAVLRELRTKYPQHDLEKLQLMAQEQLISRGPKSRAFYRVQATRKIMGGGSLLRKAQERAQNDLSAVRAELQLINVRVDDEDSLLRVFFEPGHYTVMESCGDLEVRVVRRGDLSFNTVVDYFTEDGTANAGSDYEERKGKLIFAAGVEEQTIKIPIIDDDVFEQDEYFYIRLRNPSEPAVLSTPFVATVMILDDDHAGIFGFAQVDHEMDESIGVYELKVQRYSGARGKVVMEYLTEDGTAKAGKDYEPQGGVLRFEDNETEKFINLVIIEEGNYEKDVVFYVNISAPSLAPDDELADLISKAESKPPEQLTEDEKIALLGRPKIGEIRRAQLHIKESAAFKNTVDRLAKKANAASLIGTSSWRQQFMEAFSVSPVGDDEADEDDEEQLTPSCCDYIMHFLTLFWKILFAFIPPTEIYDGYLCFFVSVVLIALVTAVIGDVASHFGCTLGIRDSVTAIIFIALGTSIPDTFASKIAAIQDEHADNSIGNVTGSNAVNVFLGIGTAWSLGAFYHTFQGTTFDVSPGNMGFALTVFLIIAAVAITILFLRRLEPIGGELGGPKIYKYASSAIFVSLWIFYLILSTLEAYGVIPGF